MALSTYVADGIQVQFKMIQGKPHPMFRDRTSPNKLVRLGIAFRSSDAPIGYFPFYCANDFDMSGDVSLTEWALAHAPVNLSAAASPHTLLIQESLADVEFTGAGSEDAVDIQQSVKRDLNQQAMAAASGVFVDGVMLALGGPTINSMVGQLVKSPVRQFVISKSISAATKAYLKSTTPMDADRLLDGVP